MIHGYSGTTYAHQSPAANPRRIDHLIDLVQGLVKCPIMEVNIHEAKTQLSHLLRRVAEGEEVPEDFNDPLPSDLLTFFHP